MGGFGLWKLLPEANLILCGLIELVLFFGGGEGAISITKQNIQLLASIWQRSPTINPVCVYFNADDFDLVTGNNSNEVQRVVELSFFSLRPDKYNVPSPLDHFLYPR